MPKPKAKVDDVWHIAGLGWRKIITFIRHPKQGRLYGVRAPTRDYPLMPRTGEGPNRGRYVRARSLLKKHR